MSVDQNMIFLADTDEFTYEVGEFIALEVAKGGSVGELHDAYPERVPNPIIVNRWREKVVPFSILMGEAEAAKAERLADETIEIADDKERLAGQAANSIKSRQWLASKLADRYGSGAEKKADGEIVGLILTDAQLMAIAAGGLPALEGKSERVLPEGESEDVPISVTGQLEQGEESAGVVELGVDQESDDPVVVTPEVGESDAWEF